MVVGWRIAGRKEGVRSALKGSKPNKSMKEWAYQESLHGKCEVLGAGEFEGK